MTKKWLRGLWRRWNGDFDYEKWFAHRAKLEQARNPISELWHRHYLMKINNRYAAFIPPTLHIPRSTVFPHGISGVYLSLGCKLGENCIIFQQVTIGSNTLEGSKRQGAPVLEDNVLVGAGARIIGQVTIGAHSRIGAGCALSSDVPPNSTVTSGTPIVRVSPTPRVNVFRSPTVFMEGTSSDEKPAVARASVHSNE